jgi:hypothetical protein
MDRSVAWRAALLQGVAVAVLAVVLALALPDSFFRSWGWLAGPAAWAACALACAAALRLPPAPVLLGAAVAGLPSVVAVVADAHWAGAPLGLLIFGAWCGWLAARVPGRRDGHRGAVREAPA